ncbi:SHC SH2 domain-binding protein 1 homolog B isoform X2 [Panulirus ornatus]
MEMEIMSTESKVTKTEESGDASSCSSNLNQVPDVFRVTWMPDDHVIELTRILQGVTADGVEKCLVQYVEDSIEPAGWRAVWRASSNPDSVLNLLHPADIFVDVVNVSREKLMADIKILEPVRKNLPDDDSKAVEQKKNAEITVPLMELYPLAEQENNVLDIATTAEIVEQIRFFYKHIWQPWDLEEEKCCYDHYLITTRLKLYQDIEIGRIPAAIGSELRNLVKRADIVQKEIKRIEYASEGEGFDFEVDQKDVACLIQLHKQMEQLKARFEMLQDPVFRELSTHQQQIERSGLMSCSSGAFSAKVKVVANALAVEDLASQLAKLPELIKSLPQVPSDATCQTFPCLQLALDMAVQGDIIVTLPGNYSLSHLGLISEGGTFVGLGDGVVIEGNGDAGDVLLDTSGNFSLQNVTLRPASGQVGLVHHEGSLILEKVIFEGGNGGVVGLGNTTSKAIDVIVQGCSAKGMDFREGSKAIISSSSVHNCSTGIQFEEGAKVTLSTSNIKDNKEYGILVVWPEGTDISKLNDIPKETLAECLLQEYVGNTVRNNNEDVAVVVSTCPSIKNLDKNSTISTVSGELRPRVSCGSLDSGCEFIENVIG